MKHMQTGDEVFVRKNGMNIGFVTLNSISLTTQLEKRETIT